jgi:hypothetical protein
MKRVKILVLLVTAIIGVGLFLTCSNPSSDDPPKEYTVYTGTLDFQKTKSDWPDYRDAKSSTFGNLLYNLTDGNTNPATIVDYFETDAAYKAINLNDYTFDLYDGVSPLPFGIVAGKANVDINNYITDWIIIVAKN